jgi:hypothetical protein
LLDLPQIALHQLLDIRESEELCKCRARARYSAGPVDGKEIMSIGLILIILLIIFLAGGFSGRFGGYGYGFGHGGVGVLGVILIVVVVLMVLGRI